jgi:simple sugar transport system ATP-binding protein
MSEVSSDIKNSGAPKLDRIEEKPEEYVIVMKGIYKEFPGVIANNYIDFYLRAGEIHALLGENGAGKTTLMKILYGLYKADSGEIYYRFEHETSEGVKYKLKKVNIKSPRDAIKLGIAMVLQHPKLAESGTVIDNVALAMEKVGFIVDREYVRKKIVEITSKYELRVDPDAYIWQLSAGEKQRVEIIKSLIRNPKVLILDEPTSLLAPQEVKELFRFLKLFKQRGGSVIFISHKLDEVVEIADRVTVLAKGKVTSVLNMYELKMKYKDNLSEIKKILIKAMFEMGDEIIEITRKMVAEVGEKIRLKVENLVVEDDRGHIAVKNFSFIVREGEIVGIAGISGNGQKELAEAIVGIRKPKSGRIIIDGKDVTHEQPRRYLLEGVGYIPDERLGMGVASNLSVMENLILKNYFKEPFTTKKFLLNIRFIKEYSKRLIKEFNIKTPSEKQVAKALSGGNIQRLILAREFSIEPRLLVALNPTFGLDFRAMKYIHSKFLEVKKRGAGVVLLSEDLDEIFALSDRIIVIHRGEKMGELPIVKATVEKVGLMMLGSKLEEIESKG